MFLCAFDGNSECLDWPSLVLLLHFTGLSSSQIKVAYNTLYLSTSLAFLPLWLEADRCKQVGLLFDIIYILF